MYAGESTTDAGIAKGMWEDAVANFRIGVKLSSGDANRSQPRRAI